MINFIYNNMNLIYSFIFGILIAVLGAIGVAFHPLLASAIITCVLIYNYTEAYLEDENISFIMMGYLAGLLSFFIFHPATFMFSFDNYLIRIFLQTLFISLLIKNNHNKVLIGLIGCLIIPFCPIAATSLIAGVYYGIIDIFSFVLGIIIYICSFVFNYYCL